MCAEEKNWQPRGEVWEVRFNGRWDNTAVKVGALGPSGPFGRYGPVEGGPGGGPGPGKGVGTGVAAVAAGEVEGYGGAGGGGGGPGGVGTPRIRVATLSGPCCAPLPVTQACNIGKSIVFLFYLFFIIVSFVIPFHANFRGNFCEKFKFLFLEKMIFFIFHEMSFRLCEVDWSRFARNRLRFLSTWLLRDSFIGFIFISKYTRSDTNLSFYLFYWRYSSSFPS